MEAPALPLHGASVAVAADENAYRLRFNAVSPGYFNSASGNIRLGYNLTNDTDDSYETIDYLNAFRLTIGSGTPITQHLSAARAAVVIPAIPANTTTSFGITVTGAAVGDSVTVTPSGDPGGAFVWSGRVSAASTVLVHIANVTTGSATPSTVDWRADVWKHL